ncbi:MAG TPA: response regulator [Luteibacter sp.]|jgi:DNA-binding response OmpR family regulator|uniref:response regulator n=1 Tax=Luteibacter sp. TaxID=1886636 RepID=UPI002F410C5D
MTILIVDDDMAFRDALERDLRRTGYGVCAAAGLASALEALLQATHRIALVNAHLPYGETRQIVAVLRRCAIPVVLLVERDAESGEPRANDTEGDRVLIKPTGLVELQRCMEQLLMRPI